MSAPHTQKIRRHPLVPARTQIQFSPRAPLTDRLFLGPGRECSYAESNCEQRPNAWHVRGPSTS